MMRRMEEREKGVQRLEESDEQERDKSRVQRKD